jgi:hypothetical protein
MSPASTVNELLCRLTENKGVVREYSSGLKNIGNYIYHLL